MYQKPSPTLKAIIQLSDYKLQKTEQVVDRKTMEKCDLTTYFVPEPVYVCVCEIRLILVETFKFNFRHPQPHCKIHSTGAIQSKMYKI